MTGLRRAEVARRAGVSTAYYTRLEQGRDRHASGSVLGALARALHLDRDERAHLEDLARAGPTSSPACPEGDEVLRPALDQLLAAFAGVPAVVLGRRTDVLGWNPPGHALLAGHLPLEAPRDPATRPNWAHLLFDDPRVTRLFADREAKARDTVADLRLALGRHPGDVALTRLVAELGELSPEFARLWSDHPVAVCAWHTRDYDHPVVGRLTLTDELLDLPGDPGQRLVVHTAAPGSRSDRRLAALLDRVAR